MGRVIAAIFVVFSLAAVGVGGLYYSGYFDDLSNPDTIVEQYAKAQELLEAKKAADALMLIDQYTHLPAEQIKLFEQEGMDWRHLELQALVLSSSVPRLFHLYARSPQTFDDYESVVLSMALLLVQWNRYDDYEKLRRRWIGKETAQTTWFYLDADHLLFQDKVAEAQAHLKSRKFEGKDDIPRLIRLALASSGNNLAESWQYLTEAFQIDPKSSEVRSFRAQIFERVDKLRMARFEYSAALVADPTNPLMRDQLAEFYRRHGDYGHALATWYAGFDQNDSDLMWLKLAFWKRVTFPVKAEVDTTAIPKGHLEPLAQYIYNLEEGSFWDEATYAKLNEKGFYTNTRQEVFWLNLLGYLENGKEQEALKLLETNTFAKDSWAPHLENALRQVLTYRLTGEVPIPVDIFPSFLPRMEREPHILFHELNALGKLGNREAVDAAISDELKALLRGDEAIAAVLMAAGWREAGLAFHRLAVIPDHYPDWVAYGLIQCTISNRGLEEALQVAMRQRPSPLVTLSQGELLLAAGKQDEAVALLDKIAGQDDLIGFRAALTLSNLYASQQDFAKAEQEVRGNQALAKHLTGREQLGHLAVLQGKLELADQLYSEIAGESFTAKSYLAKRAFDQGDFKRARELTEELIREQPDLLPLRANLREIIEAERAASEIKAVEGES